MPTYTFLCESCGQTQEEFLWYSEPHPTVCPVCGQALRQVFGCGVVGSYPVTTFGQQAELNARREGQERLRQMVDERRARGPNAGQAEADLPWHRSGEIEGTRKMDRPLDLRKVKNVEKYVLEGTP